MDDTENWHGEDGFWEEMAEVMFGPPRWAKAPHEVAAICGLAGIARPGAALDMPCGPGRHSLALARAGWGVVGVDRTASYLARGRAEPDGDRVEWVRSDMRDFRRPGAFDLALNLYSSFGYFEDPADDLRVLENLYASLRPGGVLAMDMMGKEVLARDFQPRRFHEREGMIVLERVQILDGWAAARTDWIVLRGDERRERSFRTRLYSGAVLRGLLRRAGFQEVGIFGSLDGTAYDHRAERLIALARRTG